MHYGIRCQWWLLLLSLAVTTLTRMDLVQAWKLQEVPFANIVSSVTFYDRNATGRAMQQWLMHWQRVVANAKHQFQESVLRKSFGGLQTNDWDGISVAWPISYADWSTQTDEVTVEREATALLVNLMKVMLLLDFAVIVGVVVMMRMR